jgi:lipopolysaccharide export system permease protein
MLRIFDRYIGRQVWSATLTGVLVLSGVMVLGNVYQKLDQLFGGAKIPAAVILEFIWLVVPYSLIYTIPWAFLTGILLVFGRMSADNEMVSLRMTGSSMPRICLPVFVLAVMLAAICFWVNVSLAPSAKNKMKRLFYDVVLDNPAELFVPGRVLDKVPGFRIFTGEREGTEMQDLVIVELEGARAKQFIKAKSASLELREGEMDFYLRLRDAERESLVSTPEAGLQNVEFGRFDETAIKFPLSRLKEKLQRVNASMKSTSMLWEEARTSVDAVTQLSLDKKQRSESLTELSKRYSFSLASITLMFVGIPLGITAQRRETSIGFVLSLLTGIIYYGIITIADIWNDKPSLYPHLLVWVPNLLFLCIGGLLFRRLSRK